MERQWVLLLHDQEKSAVIAQTSRVQSGWQHIRIFFPSTWQQRDVCCESPEHSDHIWVCWHSFGQVSKMSACRNMRSQFRITGAVMNNGNTECILLTHPELFALFPASKPGGQQAPAPGTWTLIWPRLMIPPANKWCIKNISQYWWVAVICFPIDD